MDVISGILARDFGICPQGNTAPMAASKTGSTYKSSFSSTWTGNKSPFFNPTTSSATANSKPTVNQHHDPILDTFNKGPVFDMPLYNDDIFISVSGVKSTSNMGFDDDVFGSGPSDQSHMESPPTSDDLLGSLGSRSGRVDRSHPASPPPYGDLLGGLGTGERKDDLDQGSVNDLLPGFSSSVWPPQPEREAHETDLPKPPKQASSVQDDPLGLFSDPLAEFTPSASASGPTKVDSSPTADNLFSGSKRLVEDPSRESSENSETVEDAWLTVLEIPLFIRPTSAPPPSRPPPPFTIKPKPRPNYSFNKDSSPVNDLEDFALGEAEQQERKIAEKEHEERDREDRERERRRIATEEEEKRRKEREERLAVERATREARERAAHEAKLRAEEAAVQRAQHEARERAVADREARANAAAEAAIFRAPSSSGEEFQKIEGESDERRKARWDREQRSKERVQKALQEMNERDLQAQREQAERHRIAESLDFEIKRWANGKEGNLRALLSSLHYILWQESGWQPVSLTDLINGADVKKVYRKANLYIHPDKVQQATLQQKYIAEKVFHILKEACNKFNSEELF